MEMYIVRFVAEMRVLVPGGRPELCLYLWKEWRRFVEHRELKGLFKHRRCFFTRDGHLVQRDRKVPEEDDSDWQSSADEPESGDDVVEDEGPNVLLPDDSMSEC